MMLQAIDEQSLNVLRSEIEAGLTWTPYDFMQVVDFITEERRSIAKAWTASLADEDDFRGVADDVFIMGERMAWDSAFFGYGIVRLNGIINLGGHDATSVLRAWLAMARERGMRYVLAPALPEDLAFVQVLGRCGFELIETRLTYHERLEHLLASDERHAVRMATEADIGILSQTACEMVNPFDRFHADRFISRADADRMMSKWVEVSLVEGFADFVVVPDVEKPRAFCTVKTHESHWASWGVKLGQSVVLGAVHPDFRGWYAKLIYESNRLLAERGAEHVFWKTQATNRGAIRTAEKLGYRMGRSEFIFRALL